MSKVEKSDVYNSQVLTQDNEYEDTVKFKESPGINKVASPPTSHNQNSNNFLENIDICEP